MSAYFDSVTGMGEITLIGNFTTASSGTLSNPAFLVTINAAILALAKPATMSSARMGPVGGRAKNLNTSNTPDVQTVMCNKGIGNSQLRVTITAADENNLESRFSVSYPLVAL